MGDSRFLAKNLSKVETMRFDCYFIFDTRTLCHIRLCIATMLRARAGECVILLGMKCSSWTVVNQGTSKRAPCCPAGDTTKVSVRMANCMAARKLGLCYQGYRSSKQVNNEIWVWGFGWNPPTPASFCFPRTILLCLLALATNNVYLLEQPFQSMLRWYGRFRHIIGVSRVSRLKQGDVLSCYVFTCLDLRRTTAKTISHLESEVFAKRHVIFSNSPHVSKLSMGPLLGWKAILNQGRKPCRSYKGKDGKRRFHGTRHLKRTEKLVLKFGAQEVPFKHL